MFIVHCSTTTTCTVSIPFIAAYLSSHWHLSLTQQSQISKVLIVNEPSYVVKKLADLSLAGLLDDTYEDETSSQGSA